MHAIIETEWPDGKRRYGGKFRMKGVHQNHVGLWQDTGSYSDQQ